MASHHTLHRRSVHFPPAVTILAAAVFLAALVLLFAPGNLSAYPRKTFVLAGSPMTIVSWNERDRSVTLVTFPQDMAADGTHGYGTYSFDAFWKLGEIDKKDGTVLAESMSEALGIPVAWYIGPKTGLFGQTSDPLSRVKDVFSWSGLVSLLSGAYRTNIPFPQFVRFVWLLQLAKPSRVDTFDFVQAPDLVAQDVVIADGTHQYVLDPDRVDARLAHLFEDDVVRRETVTTSVLNTTDMPSLGNRVARLLGNLGVSVVSVGNDTPEVGGCSMRGTADALKSGSAQVVKTVLGCTESVSASSDRADLTVRVGASYAKRFLPN